MLSSEVIRKLGDGEESDYQFDFSKISSEFYEPLLRTLQYFAQKKIDSIGFNCDSISKLEQMTVVSSSSSRTGADAKLPVIIANSIAKKKSHYISNIIELLCYVLPRSTRIKELTLSNLNIRPDYMKKLILCLPKSKSLERINFQKIPIGDELMHIMMTTLDPNQIKSVKVNYCGITSNSTNSIVQFIYKKQSNNFDGIQQFQISKTELPEKDQILIQNAFQNQNNFSSNINSPVSPTNSSNRFSQSQKLSPISNISPINSNFAHSQKFLKERKDEELAQIKAYEAENEQLRKELAELRSSLNAIKYNDNVFIVGKGAEDFVDYISNIDAKIKNLEDQRTENGFF